MKIKILFIILCFLMIKAMGQTCSTATGLPGTVNGITVTSSGTGDIVESIFPYSYLNCISFPTNCLLLGGNSPVGAAYQYPTTYTYTFSQPVNNIIIAISAMNITETINITTNTSGNLTLNQFGSDPSICGSFSLNSNMIGKNGVTNTSNGFVEVSSDNCNGYTSITLNLISDGSGMAIGLCENSIVSTGYAVPTLSTTSLSNLCPANTANLNSIVPTTPSGSSLHWFTTSTPILGSQYTTPTAATAGTYYAFYYYASTHCYSPASAAVTVNINACNPCLANYSSVITPITGGSTHILSGTVTYPSNQSYYLANNINIASGAVVSFTDAEVLVEDGVQITVEDGARLNINGSHFYSCQNMWQGFKTVRDGQIFITKSATKSSFIEDATIAVDINSVNNTNYYTSANNISINNTLFNRNNISIRLNNVSDYATATLVTGIYSNIYTSRRINFTPNVFDWASVETVGSLANPSTVWNRPNAPQTLASPFINNIQFPENEPEAFLKIHSENPTDVPKKPDFGIVTNSVMGDIRRLNPIFIGELGRDVIIDGSPQQISIFDNLDIGIQANNSLINVVNSIFQNAHSSCRNAFGIYIGGSQNFGGCNIYNSNNTIYNNNCFYNLKNAIQMPTIYSANIKDNVFRSTRGSSTGASFRGNIAINIGTTQLWDFKITNNEFTNLNCGILVKEYGGTGNTGMSGVKNIENNIFQATLTGIAALGTESFNTAIEFTGATNTIIYNAPININNNQMKNVSRGIGLRNLKNKDFNIIGNVISVANSPIAAVQTNQYGIGLFNGNSKSKLGGIVQGNTITGKCRSCKLTGIYLEKQSNTNLGCNVTGEVTSDQSMEGLTHGFRFNGKNTPLQFYDNMMYPTSQNGMTVENVGVIGIQGSQKVLGNKTNCTSNNSWGAPVSTWSAWGRVNTMVSNSSLFNASTNTFNSQLIIKSTPSGWMNPDGGGSFVGGQGIPFQTSTTPANSSIIIGVEDVSCTTERCKPTVPMGARFSKNELDIMKDIATGDIEIPFDDADQRLYAMQEQLYSELKENETLVEDEALQQFLQNNQWNSFDFIYYTERYLEAQNNAAVDMLLDYFPSNNIVDDNYYQYFDWINRMQQDENYTPPLEDVLALANRCSDRYGNVVYDAQNLYMQLTNDIYYFENNCESQPAARQANKTKKRIVNSNKLYTNIQIFPNPSNGIVNIKMPLLNKGGWKMTITDVYGKKIQEKQLQNGTVNEQLNISVKGIYFITMVNTNTGKQEVSKFVIN